MSDLRNAFAAYPDEVNVGNDEPKVEPVQSEEASPAPEANAGEADGVSTSTPDGVDGQNQKQGDATESDKQVGEPAKPKVDKSKLTRREKAESTFRRIDMERKQLRDEVRNIIDALEKSKGIKYDPKKMTMDEFLDMALERKMLEKVNSQTDSRIETMDRAYEEGLNELRDSQAEELWKDDAEAMAFYESTCRPQRAAFMAQLEKLDPTIARYVSASKNAPIFERAFLCDDGKRNFASIHTNDPQMTWDNMRRFEQQELDKLASKKTAAPAVEKTSTPSPRATGSAVRTEANPEAVSGISFDALRRVFG